VKETIVRSKTPLQAEKILAAAARLFATHRFHEARMEDIAALAEVGKGTLYRYFRDKEQLYTALLSRAGEGLRELVRDEMQRASCPRAQIVAIVRSILAYFDDNPHLLALIQHAEVMLRPNSEFPWQKIREENMALLRSVLDNARQAGQLLIDDVDVAVLMLLGGLRAVARFSKPPRPADLPERIVAGFLRGYARPNAPEAPAFADYREAHASA
jgi:AcrR family transcriptional regulator